MDYCSRLCHLSIMCQSGIFWRFRHPYFWFITGSVRYVTLLTFYLRISYHAILVSVQYQAHLYYYYIFTETYTFLRVLFLGFFNIVD
ncbi:hypothetical protein HanPI659440_Chr12g0448131 [Helianthus annuus]|nr:hypothetical protein HanPI659440_Chr12g0448131 [Helianthus annuus]